MTLNKKFAIIFALIILICVCVAVFLCAIHSDSNIVVVSVDGEIYEKIDLSQDREILVKTELGTNKIQVLEGKIAIIDADCPDKLCIRHGELHNEFDAIVCLPNRVVIEYKNEKNIDAVTGR